MTLQDLNKKKLLLLGKTRAFSLDDFTQLLKQHAMVLDDEVFDVVIEGRMMSPYEQNKLELLYAKHHYSFIDIDTLERMLAQHIQPKTLLMSLKLSNNTQRLERFLQNPHISDSLYLQLLQMYRWNGEDFFENDANRDVTAGFISRFYENIERNHNVQYATTGLLHLLRQTRNPELIRAIASLEPLALHPKLIVEIATHQDTPQDVLESFIQKGNTLAIEAMAYNENLPLSIMSQLIQQEELAQIIAKNTALDEEKFHLLKKYPHPLASNIHLTAAMQAELFDEEDTQLLFALASNEALDTSLFQKIVAREDEELSAACYRHFCKEPLYLEEAFKQGQFLLSLSANSATPSEILTQLFALNEEDILAALAANENTPVEILYQLQLDSRFRTLVKRNAGFAKHIQTQNIGWL